MSQSLLSSSWYRVSALKPRLRGHAEIHRQRFRGQLWYVLQDHQTGRFHRLSPAANLALALMDGTRTLDDIWDMVGRKAGDDPPTQDEMIQLLTQLHASDLLQSELPPDFGEISERAIKASRSAVVSRLRNPLALRFPLLDPDRFLDATIGLVRPIFSYWGLLAWLVLVGAGGVLAAMHWAELTGDATDRLLSVGNLALIVAVYPFVKALHEAGHAYAAKAWGGQVHEVGIMLLIFVPAPYVDATSATAFQSKARRMVVSGAGIMVEFGLAALAMIFWVNAEPGLARAIAFNVMLIGSVSTLFFNGNPLLRFDGYYILMDLIEIPNLGSRANKYFWYLVQRYLLGVDTMDSPANVRSERKWLFGYAVLAFIYRIFLSIAIALIVATKLFFVGVALALFSLASTFVFPMLKGIGFLFTSPRLQHRRGRAITLAGAFLMAIVGFFGFVPLPYATVAQGVVWLPGEDEVRAATGGVLVDILTTPDTVAPGTPLLRFEDPGIGERRAVLASQVDELNLQYEAMRFRDRTQAAVLLERRAHAEAILTAFDQRAAGLTLHAGLAGRFVLPDSRSLLGRYFRQGDLIGYVVPARVPVIRIVVPQSEVDLVRARTGRVDVRLAFAPELVIPASIGRAVPAAQQDLPSLALSTMDGGDIAIGGNGAAGPAALESLFVFDIALEGSPEQLFYGARAWVRLDHGSEPLFARLARAIRQTLLGQLGA
ncbi:MAG: PqqD family peptide modification chaperone [Devosia sp.]|nr:PqqD family peptide modification chaperone [Devosia sp.]